LKKLLNKKGFTIVEIIVTLAVLGIVIGPLMTMFITSQKINNEGSKEYKSIQLAQEYMEEIKEMETFNYTTLGYTKTEDSGIVTYTKTVDETSSDYGVNIEIEAESEAASVSESSIDFDSTLTIDSSIAKYTAKDGTVSQFNITDGYVTIEINSTGVTINSGSEIIAPLLYNKIKVVLSSDAEIDVSNNLDDKVAFYIYNLDDVDEYNCTFNVIKGEVQKINNNNSDPAEETADNILYSITIDIKSGTETINSIKGTTIFKYNPN
jgi:prepilin-type N-terminal cleavage/methylation domain-containing protein